MVLFEHVMAYGLDASRFEPEAWSVIQKMGKRFDVIPVDSNGDVARLHSADCLLLPLNGHVSREMMDQLPKLRYIGVNATGFDKIDIVYAKQKGITVTNIPGYSTNAVAEFVFGVVLEHIRDLSRAKKQAKEGDYSDAPYNGTEITGKTVGIVGLGQIGQKTARIAKGFDCNVMYWSRNRKPEMEKTGIHYHELDSILAQSNILSIHVEKNTQTIGMLTREKIGKIRNGTIIVNTCNTDLFDVEALEERLAKNELVYLTMASRTNPETIAQLSKHSGFTVYPTLTYKTKEANALRQKIFIENMQHFLSGNPVNVVNR